jgi:hypothetical protein
MDEIMLEVCAICGDFIKPSEEVVTVSGDAVGTIHKTCYLREMGHDKTQS